MVKIRNHVKKYSKYTFLLFFSIIIILAILILKPFVAAIIGGVIIAYIFYPLYDRIKLKLKNENLSAFLTTLIILLVVTIPLIFFFTTLSSDVSSFYLSTKQKLSSGEIMPMEEDSVYFNKFQEWISDPKIKFHLNNALTRATGFLVDYTSGLLVSIPILVLNLLITIFVTFFGFRDGKDFVTKTYSLLPLKPHFKKDLFKQTQDVIFATVYGNVIVAIIQGLIAMIGFMIFGVSSPVLWGMLTVFAALIPFIGTALIWLPASLVLIFDGIFSANNYVMWKGIGLMIYGLLIISSIDNILKPKIIGDKAKLHPLVVLLGIFGGISLMGVIGLIVGPLILALLVSFIRVYERDRSEIIG